MTFVLGMLHKFLFLMWVKFSSNKNFEFFYNYYITEKNKNFFSMTDHAYYHHLQFFWIIFFTPDFEKIPKIQKIIQERSVSVFFKQCFDVISQFFSFRSMDVFWFFHNSEWVYHFSLWTIMKLFSSINNL